MTRTKKTEVSPGVQGQRKNAKINGHRAKKGDTHRKLSKIDEKFVLEYTTHFNATQAALNSGLVRKGTGRNVAAAAGCTKLKTPKVKAEVERIVGKVIEEKEELLKRTIQEVKALAFSDIKDVVDYDGRSLVVRDFTDIDTRAIHTIERNPVVTNSQGIVGHSTKVKLHDKVAALNLLARYLGMLKDTEVTVNIDYDSIRKSLEGKLLK